MSSGFRNWLLGGGNVIEAFDRGVIEVYSGTQPDAADLPPTGTLLGRVTRDGNTFAHGDPTYGLSIIHVPSIVGVLKDPTEDWILTGVADGTAGWWRFKANSPTDDDSESTSFFRIDGVISAPFEEFFLADTAITTAGQQDIELFQLTFNV